MARKCKIEITREMIMSCEGMFRSAAAKKLKVENNALVHFATKYGLLDKLKKKEPLTWDELIPFSGMTRTAICDELGISKTGLKAAISRLGMADKFPSPVNGRPKDSTSEQSNHGHDYTETREFTCTHQGCNNTFKKKVYKEAGRLRFACNSCKGIGEGTGLH